MIITLKDGSTKEYDQAMSVLDIAKDISEGLARVATSARVNGEVVDLRHIVDEDCELEILTFDNEEGKGAFWHTTSHIMAQAIKRLYPDTKLAIGPSIENGFYYDVDRETPFVAEDLEKIEKEMKKIVKEALPIERFTKTREDAIAYFKEKEELEALGSQVFHSPTLFNFIKENKNNYKAIIPITIDYSHVYYTTLYAPEKTIVIPTMHYHKTAFRSTLTQVFTKAAYIAFNTTAEQKLARKIFGMHMAPHSIVSVGIELSAPSDWAVTQEKYNLPDEYMLYVGRVDQGKLNNVYTYFLNYKKVYPNSDLKFVLVGKQYSDPFNHPDIIYTNFVEEQEKTSIIQHAKIVINPSLYESLSLILLEAMALKKAMLVNGNCNVLKEHCHKSNNAALYYTNEKSFIDKLHMLDSSTNLRLEMGEKGYSYVNSNYDWNIIMNKLKHVIENI